MVAVVHNKIKVHIYEGDKPLTIERAKELLGWLDESDGPKAGFGSEYAFKDVKGNKVRLKNNLTNRPFRRELAMQYALEMLRGKWALNGETIVVDRHGKIQSGQHRLAGLVFAEQMRLDKIKYWQEEYGVKGPISIEALVVEGISEKAEVVDTLDIGQKRTLGDVLFRNHTFASKELSDKDCKKLANILAYATRLVWLRQGGQMVSDAPKFPHSEALEMIERHPRLVEACQWVYTEDGTGAEGGKISQAISLGYAAALFYLGAISGTDRQIYDETGEVDDNNWDKTEKFWSQFASGANLREGSPILALKNALPKLDASGAMGRDEICGTVAKAFNFYMDGDKNVAAKDIRVKKSKDDNGKPTLAETPRFGGIDVEVEPVDDPTSSAQAKQWGVGDTAWVDTEGEPWFGTIQEIITPKRGEPQVVLVAQEDEQSYKVPLSSLCSDKPTAEAA